jgi:hypothetical protein
MFASRNDRNEASDLYLQTPILSFLEIVDEAIEGVWEYVKKTADFVGIEPEELLE